jgi:chaperonin GroEL (HSP60 family)
MLQDIAVLTGGQVVASDLGFELKDAKLDMLGRARQVSAEGKHHYRGRRRKPADIKARVAQIKAAIEVPRRNSTRKSFRRGWPSFRAASPSSRSAQPPKPK